MLNSFRLNGRTVRFHSDSKVTFTLYSVINSFIGKYCSVLSFHQNGHTSGSHPYWTHYVKTTFIYSIITEKYQILGHILKVSSTALAKPVSQKSTDQKFS